MANTARTANVRSHRRGASGRRLPIAPWIIAAVIVVLMGGAGAYGVSFLLKNGCTGSVKANIVAAPATATLLEGLARGWADTSPAVGDACASVEIAGRDTAIMAQSLGTDWDSKAGAPPDVWVPDSTAWVRRASTAATAERMMPDLQPSLARTPAVIAMPRPMAEALGWPTGELSWQDLANKTAADPAGWGKYGKPEWGPFRFGMTDPLKSTAGLLSLMAVLDGNDDGEVSAESG